MYMIFLLLSGTFSAIASILLRIAGRSAGGFSPAAIALLDRPMLFRLAALCAYGLGFICYAVSLKRIELSVAYPLMVGIAVLEIFVFGYFNHEALTLRSAAGAGCLMLAMVLLYSPRVGQG